ncbi:MAG: hypothetical protein ACOYEU_02295 [Limnochordia bacterium]
MGRLWLVLAAVLILNGVGAAASDFDLDSLFGGEILLDLEETEPDRSAAELVLTGDRLEIGGSYRLGAEVSRLQGEIEVPLPIEVTRDEFSLTFNGDVYMDLRPEPTWRAFLKAKYAAQLGYETWPEERSTESLDISLHELFLDYTLWDRLYLRAGKQTVNWGVGYFFSPADVINIGRIDPFDAEAPREGPLALKAHYPMGSNNYYVYVIFEDMESIGDVAVAPKVEYVVGRTEMGLGAFYRDGRPLQLMGTLSSTLGKVSVFGEAVLVVDSQSGPGERLDWQWTVGGRYSYRDEEGLFDLTSAAQYLYSGKHEAAVLVNWNNLLKTRLSASALWLASLSDKSGLVNFGLNLPSLESVQPQVGVRYLYSADQSVALGSGTQLYFAVTFGSGSF